MSNEILASIKLDLDEIKKQLNKAATLGAKAGKEFGDSFGGGVEKEIGDRLPPIFKIFTSGPALLVGGAIAASFAAIKAVNLAEHVEQINAQFEALTKGANISGRALASALDASAAGLVDNSDLLEAANKGIIALGQSAQQLPQIFEVARKATSVFGGDLINNFEAMNQAISTGNTRALKNLGIIIDQDKAFKDFANSIGVSVTALNQAGKQQAILNAVLAAGNDQFKNVDPSLRLAGDAFTRLRVSVGQLIEDISILTKRVLGPSVTFIANAMTDMAASASNVLNRLFGDSTSKMKAQRETLLKEIKATEAELANPGLFQRLIAGPDALTKNLAKMKGELDQVNAKLKETDRTVASSAQAGGLARFIDPAIMEQNRLKFETELAKATSDRLNAELTAATTLEAQQLLLNEKKIAIENEFQARLALLKQQYVDTKIINQMQFDALEEQLERDKAARIEALQQQTGKRLIDAQKAIQQSVSNGLITITTGLTERLGAALIKGGASFADFKNFALNALGDMSINIGKTMVMQSAAFTAMAALISNPFTAAAGSLAFGLALIALGGLLKAAAGGGGGDSGGAVGAGGGVGAGVGGSGGGGSSLSTQLPEEAKRNEPTTGIVVNVQGNVLDRRETGLALAEVINETFGSQGVSFATGGT